MPDLLPWPFSLPDRFLDALGYSRVVEAFDSPAMRARLADLLRRQGIAEPQPLPTGPRRYVMLHWEPAGDELAFADGVHSGAGQLQHWVCATRKSSIVSVGNQPDRAILRARPHLVRALGAILGCEATRDVAGAAHCTHPVTGDRVAARGSGEGTTAREPPFQSHVIAATGASDWPGSTTLPGTPDQTRAGQGSQETPRAPKDRVRLPWHRWVPEPPRISHRRNSVSPMGRLGPPARWEQTRLTARAGSSPGGKGAERKRRPACNGSDRASGEIRGDTQPERALTSRRAPTRKPSHEAAPTTLHKEVDATWPRPNCTVQPRTPCL